MSSAILLMVALAWEPAKSQEKTGSELLVVESIRALAAKYPSKSVELLLGRMQGELPKGWRASYERECSVLEISRDEAVLATYVFVNAPPDQKPEKSKFAFALRVLPAVSPHEHRRLSAENARIQKELGALYEELVKKGISQKFDSFFGRTVEEETAVARYNALKKSQHRLPEFHHGEISLQWLYGWLDDKGWGPDVYIEDERVREECTEIQKKILALLSKYETTPARR
jgi:hypothetical protein